MEFVLVIALLFAIGIAVYYFQKRRTQQLQSRFGPEYQHLVKEVGGARKAEAQLAERAQRVDKFNIRPLLPGDRERFLADWHLVQAEFVDDPKGAVSHADSLLGDVMAARGYPVSDFDQRSADLSVDHPVVVQNYRSAHDIAVRHARGQAGTEDLRQAMIHYRALFDELANEQPSISTTASGETK